MKYPQEIRLIGLIALAAPFLAISSTLSFADGCESSTVTKEAYSSKPPKIALVYNGSGVCAEGCASAAAQRAEARGFTVQWINEKNWSESLFQKARVWIQPGGESRVVAKTLNSVQKARIRKFVARGGGYVGFCAGGFFASRIRLEADGSPGNDEMLGILPLVSEEYVQSTAASIVNVKWNGVHRYLYWEGGPYFWEPDSSRAEVVAYYENGQAASVRGRYGKGRVFVSGPHPEAPQFWRDYYKLIDGDGLDFDLAEEMIDWAAKDF